MPSNLTFIRTDVYRAYYILYYLFYILFITLMSSAPPFSLSLHTVFTLMSTKPPPTTNLSAMHLSRPWSGPGLKDKWSDWGTAVYKELIGASLGADVEDQWRLILRWLERCSPTCSRACKHKRELFTQINVCTSMNWLRYRSVFGFGSYDALGHSLDLIT